MDCAVLYDSIAGEVKPGSHNVVSVTNAAAGLWDCVFAHTSRTADASRFFVQANIALNQLGRVGEHRVTAIGVDTITIRLATYDAGGALANKNFSLWFKELG